MIYDNINYFISKYKNSKAYRNKSHIDKPIISLDIGSKRIGVALSDKSKIIASPLSVININNNIFNNLLDLIIKYNIDIIVIGITTIKTQDNIMKDYIINFTDKFNQFLLSLDYNLNIIYHCEDYTSFEAREILKTKKNKHKLSKDSIAAAIIMQDFLNLYNQNL